MLIIILLLDCIYQLIIMEQSITGSITWSIGSVPSGMEQDLECGEELPTDEEYELLDSSSN